ncbi:hypothetical protein RFI_06163 [Reticulomyxa filosa]|uniref:Uncharacterized protein n=1 Tax=Reticulomyxa filosa TaxID=46433 RepID=X6NYK1_RETFI|nr:hypothetical protein RFI_06163 [Reticulomyxa filosa]|eukprot:ETO30958.1 hypothetical protein RFI_06163 [Reticulomyxa filosa]
MCIVYKDDIGLLMCEENTGRNATQEKNQTTLTQLFKELVKEGELIKHLEEANGNVSMIIVAISMDKIQDSENKDKSKQEIETSEEIKQLQSEKAEVGEIRSGINLQVHSHIDYQSDNSSHKNHYNYQRIESKQNWDLITRSENIMTKEKINQNLPLKMAQFFHKRLCTFVQRKKKEKQFI